MSSIAAPASHGDTAVLLARQALAKAKANATVDADRRAHSPGCVACDQKLVDKAAAQLSAAQSAQATPAPSSGAGPLSIIA